MTQTDTMRSRIALICIATILSLTSCQPESSTGPGGTPLVINELMSDNNAAWVDEAGEVSDYIEVANASERSVHLRDYALRSESGRAYEFPDTDLDPGGFVVI